jgi:hypothetical protein
VSSYLFKKWWSFPVPNPAPPEDLATVVSSCVLNLMLNLMSCELLVQKVVEFPGTQSGAT